MNSRKIQTIIFLFVLVMISCSLKNLKKNTLEAVSKGRPIGSSCNIPGDCDSGKCHGAAHVCVR